ncbi:MAG: hypothetical protein ACYS1A_17815 [Planctomycetota bacterium]|jgi:hypothetical protein
MAFSFTALVDYVFDQVLSFTNMNTLKNNQQDIHDSLNTEHVFTSGVHRRITKDQNLIINPTARRGNQFWWDGGAGESVNDPGYAAAANFAVVPWTGTGARGARWSFAGASGGFKADLNERIPVGGSVDITLSAMLQITGYVAGTFIVDVVCYDGAGNHLANIARTSLSATTPFAKFEATGTTHASTAYVRVRKALSASADSTVFRVEQMKLERDSTATAYSDESSNSQYLSASYFLDTTTTSPTAATGATTIVDFESMIYDDPGTDRVTTGAAWRFTADRYMKVRINVRIQGVFAVNLGALETFFLWLYKNGALHSQLKIHIGNVLNIPNGFSVDFLGQRQFKLNQGDYFDIRVNQNSGGNFTFEDGDSPYLTYIDIEEIS